MKKGAERNEETHIFYMYMPDALLPNEYSSGKRKRHMGLYFFANRRSREAAGAFS